MAIGKVCSREVVVASPDTSIEEAAKLMRKFHVGNLVIVSTDSGSPIPVGIVTDRDVVLSIVALGLDPKVITLGDVVSKDLVTCEEDNGVFECLQQMRSQGIRRMPVVNREGILTGIVTVDDLVQLLAGEMAEVGKLIEREQARERQARA